VFSFSSSHNALNFLLFVSQMLQEDYPLWTGNFGSYKATFALPSVVQCATMLFQKVCLFNNKFAIAPIYTILGICNVEYSLLNCVDKSF
jgi:hypothetical protein